jgi:hypothetical protein
LAEVHIVSSSIPALALPGDQIDMNPPISVSVLPVLDDRRLLAAVSRSPDDDITPTGFAG